MIKDPWTVCTTGNIVTKLGSDDIGSFEDNFEPDISHQVLPDSKEYLQTLGMEN